MEIRILGPLEVRDAGGAIRLGGPQQRALLALLVIRRGEVVPTDTLVDELWPEDPPAAAVKTVQMYVSQLRRALGDGVLTTHGRGYRLESEPADIDAQRFEAVLSRASAEERPDRAVALLGDALALWRGPALAGVADAPLARAESRRLEELRLVAVETRLGHELELRPPEALIPELQALVTAHPLRERLRVLSMLALYRAGRQAEALDVYRDARHRLDRDLGLEPTRELRELEAAILRQDPALDAVRPAARGRPARRARARRLLVAGGGLVALAAVAAVLASSGAGSKPSLASVGANSVAVIEPAEGRIVGTVPVGAEPGAMALAGGRLWVTNGGDRTLTAIDVRSRRVVRAVGLTALPHSVAADARTLWLGNGYDGTLSRLELADGLLSRPFRPQPRSTGRLALATGFGSVWVGSQDDVVARLDPATQALRSTIAGVDNPEALAAGAGAVWVLPSSRRAVLAIDPRIDRTVDSIPIGDAGRSIAVTAEAVWVLGERRLWRIDPRRRVATATVGLRSPATALAAGEGAVWVADGLAGTVTRIDPERAEVERTIRIGRTIGGILAGDGAVWVAAR